MSAARPSGTGRGAAGGAGALLRVALHEPEIPNNTGNIGRTCIATGCALHLIRPLGFDTSVKACRRAGLDYWARLRPVEHESLGEFVRAEGVEPGRMWVFTTKAARPVWEAEIARGDVLLFGKETKGLPEDVLAEYAGRLVTLPMSPRERSLNLATAVCAAVYEGIRQMVGRGEVAIGADGRLREGGGGRSPGRDRSGARGARAD